MSLIALEYHDVVEEPGADDSGFPGGAANSYKLSPANFREHLDAVAASGVAVRCASSDGSPAPGRASATMLTFDDGGRSALDAIAPALERRGWRGHFFIASDCIGTHGFLDADGIRELVRRGHVVGSHSRTHPLRIASLTRAQLDDEWGTSVAVLGEILGERPAVASIPGGALSALVIDRARAAGVRVLFTSEPTTRLSTLGECAVIGRYTLRRAHGRATVDSLLARNPSGRALQWVSWNGKKVAKKLGGSGYLRIRDALFRAR